MTIRIGVEPTSVYFLGFVTVPPTTSSTDVETRIDPDEIDIGTVKMIRAILQ